MLPQPCWVNHKTQHGQENDYSRWRCVCFISCRMKWIVYIDILVCKPLFVLFWKGMFSFHFMSFQRNPSCKHESFKNISASHDNRILIISYQDAKNHHCQHLPSSQPHSERLKKWIFQIDTNILCFRLLLNQLLLLHIEK